jgi:BirA family transcriptional regulator, biotin operon repressor / biotin---[acetyl-CoA-carboxylase] ligase
VTDYRQPLDQARLALELPSLNGPWTAIGVVRQTGSTNADLLDLATRGLEPGAILVAEEQTVGRGRLGRSWVSPPGAALTFSVLLRPQAIPPARRGWLPLLAGIATTTAVRQLTGLDARLKWPNDVLVGSRKLAGILTESTGSQPPASPGEEAVVIGIGINVSNTAEELPTGPGGLQATSLLAEGIPVERDVLLVEVLRALGQWLKTYSRSPDPEQSGLLSQYQRMSATIGQNVRVEMPGGVTMAGLATAIDDQGQLLVEADGSTYPVAAGDVIHLR